MANEQNLTNAGRGRRKGSKNKFTNLKDAFMQAFEELGDVEGLVKWGKIHRTEFYTILARLLPLESKINGNRPDEMKPNWSVFINACENSKQSTENK